MADEVLKRDQNFITVLGGVTDDSNQYVTMLRVDPITKRLLISASGSGTGTVTSVSVVTANGVSGSVANPTTTPAITLTLGDITPSSVTVSGLTASQIVATDASKVLQSLATSTYPSLTELSYVKGVTSNIQTQINTKAPSTSPTFATSITGSYLDASEILITDGSKNIISAAVATYPSLTELSYVKGLTSSVQTQLNAKGSGTVTAVSVATANGVSGSSSGGATPALTIVLGAITPTTVNGNTFTTGSSTYTGTAAQTYTFPTTSASIARTDAAQTFTGTQTFSQIVTTNNAITASGNAATVPITSRISTVTNNSAATLTITITTTSAVDGQMIIVRILDSSAAAQTITWVNTENSGVSAPTTSNGSTTLPLTVGFMYNAATSKWRCIASA